jgi:MFS family permease
LKAQTLPLCLPLVVLSAQQNAVLLTTPAFLDAQGYSISAIGALNSIVPLVTLASRIPAGQLYTTARARTLMTLSLLAVAVTSALYGIADTLPLFVLVAVLNGLAGGVATTIYLALFLDSLSQDESRARAMGFYTGSVALGFAAGGYVAGYIADHRGYPAMFLAAGAAALLALGFLAMIDKPATTADAAPKPVTSAPPRHWRHMLLAGDVVTLLLTAVFLNILYKIPATFLPVYAIEHGLRLTDVGVIMGAYALCNAVVRPFSGPWVERWGPDRTSRIALPLQALTLMLIPFFQVMLPLLAVAIGAGVLRALVMVSNTVSMTETMREPRFTKGMASGLFSAAGDVGYILGPIFGGAVAAWTGSSQLFFVAPALIAVFFVSAILIVRAR